MLFIGSWTLLLQPSLSSASLLFTLLLWLGDENSECSEWSKSLLFLIGELILEAFFNFTFLGVWTLVSGSCDRPSSLGEREGIW